MLLFNLVLRQQPDPSSTRMPWRFSEASRPSMFYLVAGAIVAYAAYQHFFGDKPDDHPPQPQLEVRRNIDDRPPQPQPEVRRNIDDRHRQPPCRHGYLDQVPISPARTWQDIDTAERDQIIPEETSDSLRSRARQEGDLMARCSQQSQEAYNRRDHALAKALSEESKCHALKMDKLDADACAIIFKENNRDRGPCDVDLHGLYVKEAIACAQETVTDARRRGDSEIRLIVGQGNHSEGGVSRLKPAVQEDLQMCGHRVEVDPGNPGVLLVRVGGM